MLERLGLERVDELFADVPESLRYPELQLPAGKSEFEVLEELRSVARRNSAASDVRSFVGAGAYRHFIPAVVPFLSSRGEFATSYTPYQAEASQGTLQSIFEYQSMLSALLEVDVVNASHYDGSTAVAEAVLMSVNVARGRRRDVIVSDAVHPYHREVVRSYSDRIDIRVRGDERERTAGELASLADEETACVVVQYPDFYGRVPDLSGVAEAVHEQGALFVVHVDPVALGLFRSPGSLGADIVTGEGQPLGIPVSFGGPYLGIFGCSKSLVRRMPGRLAGQAYDKEGRRGYVLTLNTREQHIRREKATSNICTNQGLMALRAAIFLAALGPHGLREMATLCYHKTAYAVRRIAELRGFAVHEEADTARFREFVARTPIPAAELVERAQAYNVIPGVALSRFDPQRTHELLVCVTELDSRADIDRLVDVLSRCHEGNAA